MLRVLQDSSGFQHRKVFKFIAGFLLNGELAVALMMNYSIRLLLVRLFYLLDQLQIIRNLLLQFMVSISVYGTYTEP